MDREPDYPKALTAVETLRVEMQQMRGETISDRFNLLQVAGRMLDMIERLIVEHRTAEVEKMARYRRPMAIISLRGTKP